MSDLSDLYQELILDHNRRPRNYGSMTGICQEARGHNPLCGDRLAVYLRVVDDTIQEIQFEGNGCAISKASASLMTEAVKGRSVSEALDLFDRFQALITTPIAIDVGTTSLGKLMVFAGVREFPMRVKCASLAWHTFKSALTQPGAVVHTE